MLRQLFRAAVVTIIGLVGCSAQVLAQNASGINVAVGYGKGGSAYNVVVKDTPGTKLVLYVDDKHPVHATVNKHDWATFKKVHLTGTGKLSFTKVLRGQHGNYQVPIAYTQRYTVSKNKVGFSNYITTTTATSTKPIAFAITTEPTSSLAKGATQVKTKGVDGTEKLTYRLTYTNSQKTANTLISTTLVVPPISEVLEEGTYVAPSTAPAPSCTNGSYVNSSGNTVCSPEAAPSAPAGATAQCKDGTYSFSQHASGTCSHHGGVANWL
jgi:hypothetical protein